MGTISGSNYISGYTGDQIDAALAAARSAAGVNGIVKGNGSGVFSAQAVDSTPTASSNNPVTSGGVKAALDAKQNTLTFDNTPTAGSTNPVTSGGIKTYVDGSYTIAGKKNGTTLGDRATAEGQSTTASGNDAHAEGVSTSATAPGAHAQGLFTRASGDYSDAAGIGTLANHESQHVFGEYNVPDASIENSHHRGVYIEIVGNGTDSGARSNARTLDWDGNEKLAGKLTLGAEPAADMDAANKKYVDDTVVSHSDIKLSIVDGMICVTYEV